MLEDSDLEDILGDGEVEDDLDDDLEDGGEEVGDELSSDYAISDQGVRALSGERGGALMRPKMLGSAVHLEGGVDLIQGQEKKIRGGATVVRITIEFANGRKLYVLP